MSFYVDRGHERKLPTSSSSHIELQTEAEVDLLNRGYNYSMLVFWKAERMADILNQFNQFQPA